MLYDAFVFVFVCVSFFAYVQLWLYEKLDALRRSVRNCAVVDSRSTLRTRWCAIIIRATDATVIDAATAAAAAATAAAQ